MQNSDLTKCRNTGDMKHVSIRNKTWEKVIEGEGLMLKRFVKDSEKTYLTICEIDVYIDKKIL